MTDNKNDKNQDNNNNLGQNQKKDNRGGPHIPIPQNMKAPKNILGNVFFYVFLGMAILLIFISFSQTTNYLATDQVPISEVVSLINDEKVQDITVIDNDLEVLLRDGSTVTAKKEASLSFDDLLTNNNVDRSKIQGQINIEERISMEQIFSALITVGLPIILILFIFRQMKGASNDVFAFGRSKAKLFNKESSKVTFDDVAGNEEAKKDMLEIVDFLKHPKKYLDVGARVPKGVLLVGPSGVGKTLLAKAIAGEANVPFFSVAGSEFMEMLVGVGSSRVRDLFQMARAAEPSLIFIDEIDAIGRQRGMGIGGGHDEREQTLNQILIEMDGFDPRTNVIVIAATNRPDMLDPALIRAGRFDRRIMIPMPDLEDRQRILEVHMKGKKFAEGFDIQKLARKTVGFSGADLENMLNEAAIIVARNDRTHITDADVDEASLKVTIGPERRRIQDENDKKITAYHEAGHAIVGAHVPDMDPVGRVTIVPRGGSLGHTYLPPMRDRYNETRTRLISLITMMLGGRAAEEIVFNEMTTGAGDDIDKATNVARKMVTEYGMSSLGPISYFGREGSNWLAKQMGEMPHYSQEMAAKIDVEVEKIIDGCYKNAKKILTERRALLDKVTKELIERETIDGDEFAALLK